MYVSEEDSGPFSEVVVVVVVVVEVSRRPLRVVEESVAVSKR